MWTATRACTYTPTLYEYLYSYSYCMSTYTLSTHTYPATYLDTYTDTYCTLWARTVWAMPPMLGLSVQPTIGLTLIHKASATKSVQIPAHS